MARIVFIAMLVLASREAAARRVIMRPSVAISCPGTAAWETTRSCVARFGKVSDVRTTADMHLIRVTPEPGDQGVWTAGLYLYTLRKGKWVIGGELRGEGQTVSDIKPVTIARHAVWRIDFHYAISDFVSTDGETTRTARIRATEVAFCAGTRAECSHGMTSCDTFVAGRLLWTFRGKLDVAEDGRAHIRGDHTHGGERCEQEEIVYIPEPDE